MRLNELNPARQTRIGSTQSSIDKRRNGVRSRDQDTKFLHAALFALQLRRYSRRQQPLTRTAVTGMDYVEAWSELLPNGGCAASDSDITCSICDFYCAFKRDLASAGLN